MCFRENAHIAILAADSKRSFWGGMDRDEGLAISVRLAMCLVEEGAIRRVVEHPVTCNS